MRQRGSAWRGSNWRRGAFGTVAFWPRCGAYHAIGLCRTNRRQGRMKIAPCPSAAGRRSRSRSWWLCSCKPCKWKAGSASWTWGRDRGIRRLFWRTWAQASSASSGASDLAAQARSILADAGYERVNVVVGDGSQGYAPDAPYDRIAVAAGSPHVPAALVEQLAPNGRLVLPVGSADKQYLTIVSKDAQGQVSTRTQDECQFVPLVGAQGWPGRTCRPF